MRKIGEVQTFTRDEIEGHLEAAIEILDTHYLPVLSHKELLVAIFDKLCSKQVAIEQMTMTPAGGAVLGGNRG